MKHKELEQKGITTYYCVIWSYDNFMYNYEEDENYFADVKECVQELLRQKEENKDFQKSMGEPKISLRIRKFEETKKEIWVSDYTVRKYRNKYFLKRAEDIL